MYWTIGIFIVGGFIYVRSGFLANAAFTVAVTVTVVAHAVAVHHLGPYFGLEHIIVKHIVKVGRIRVRMLMINTVQTFLFLRRTLGP